MRGMTQVYENIFFMENGFVTVYWFRKSQKKFEYLKRDGQKKYPLTDDFWEEWRRETDYVEDADRVDFCFIYDEENALIHDSFLERAKPVEGGSCWSMEAIRSFFEETVADTHVRLCLPGGKTVRFDKENQMFGGDVNSEKVFYTNIELETPKDVAGTGGKKEEKEEEEGEISLFARYFKELIRRENEI